MPTFPDTNFCGPHWNWSDGKAFKKIRNKTDRACFKHDLQYGRISKRGYNPFTHYSYSDKEFRKRLAGDGSAPAFVAKTYFGAKKRVTDYFGMSKIKRLKVNGPDNIPQFEHKIDDAPDLPSNMPSWSIKSGTPDVVPGSHVVGFQERIKSGYEGRQVNKRWLSGQWTTGVGSLALTTFEEKLFLTADLQNLVSGVKTFTVLDANIATGAITQSIISYAKDTKDVQNLGYQNIEYSILVTYQIKNNGKTTCWFDTQWYQHKKTSSNAYLDQKRWALQDRYNTTTPAVPFINDYTINMLDVKLRKDVNTYTPMKRKLIVLKPGQSTNLSFKTTFYTNPSEVFNAAYTYTRGSFGMLIRMHGDIGNNGTVVNYEDVKLDWMRKDYTSVRFKENSIKDTRFQSMNTPSSLTMSNKNVDDPSSIV